MRSSRAAALLLFLTAPLLAQTPPVPTTAQLHDELRRMRDEILAAIDKGDVEGVLVHLHRNVIFTPMNAEVCRGPEQVRAYFDKMMKGPGRIVDRVHFDLKVDALTDFYGDTGIAYGSSDDRYKLKNGMDFAIHTRWTCSLVRENGRWLITSFQSTANVFDNPILDATAKRRGWFLAGIAAIVGLILGVLLARRRRT
jgi:ketosteroid isomerase-like protein